MYIVAKKAQISFTKFVLFKKQGRKEACMLGAGNSTTSLTIIPGMTLRDIESTFATQVGVSPSYVKFSIYSYNRKKVMTNIKEGATPEMLGIRPDDILKVGVFYFLPPNSALPLPCHNRNFNWLSVINAEFRV